MALNSENVWFEFILKEWLLLASACGLVLTSVYSGRLPAFSLSELQVLLLLFVLFVVVRGLENSGFILWVSRKLEQGRLVPLKLTLATFFLSMIVTNDVVLTVIVPLTLLLNTDRKDILVILEALAANAGSALTPIGNPQNLFIYWSYGVAPGEFVAAIAAFSGVYLLLLTAASLAVRTRGVPGVPPEAGEVGSSAYIYMLLLVLIVLAVLHVLPISSVLLAVAYAVVFDRNSLRVDYALLLSFLCFFGLADNIRLLVAPQLRHAGDVFLATAASSQLISNVPATLLFARFTTQWQALLWGASVGGFGSLVGSLANLIAYRIYIVNNRGGGAGVFTIRFFAFGYLAFFTGVALYFGIRA